MKNKILLLLLVLLFVSGCAKNPTANVTIKTALATEKYTQDEDISHLSEGTLSISAAKGETEGAQFIVKADQNIAYDFSVSDLKSKGATIDATAVTIQTELYSYAEQMTYSDSLPTGYYPDALIPANYIVDAKENLIEANKNQGFFVDIKVPEDAEAGIYSGEITMKCKGQVFEIPVELEVYDFVIDAIPHTKTAYLIWQSWMGSGELDSTDEKYMDYYDMMLEYNLCAYTFPHTTAEEFVSYVREYYDRIPCFGIPYDEISNTENDWNKYDAYMSALAEACVEDNINYFDKAYYYFDLFYDEYHAFEWRREAMESILQECDSREEKLVQVLVKQGKIESATCELAKTIIEMQHVIPCFATYDETLKEYDITFCPAPEYTENTKYITDYHEQTSEGKDLYWYHAIGSIAYPRPSKTLNDYLVTARDHFWWNYENDIVGDLFWNVCAYGNWNTLDEYGQPILLNDVYTTASHDGVSNGDGYLLYPGFGYGSDKPFASLRMVSIRDGIDDNTYMGMLGESYARLAANYEIDVEDAKEFITFLNKEVISNHVSKLNSQKLLDARDAIAKAIELADNDGVILKSFSIEQNELSYVIYADASTELVINGENISSAVAGTGVVYKGTVELKKSKELSISFVKNGKSETLKLWTPKSGSTLFSFDEEQESAACIVRSNYGANVQWNTEENYARNGASVKISATGWDFGNSEHNEQYEHTIGFSLADSGKKFSDLESIEFWVYNSQSKRIEVSSYVSGQSDTLGKLEFTYDTFYLEPQSWTKVTIDNFDYISRDKQSLNEYSQFGISLPNQIGTTNVVYVDDIFIR